MRSTIPWFAWLALLVFAPGCSLSSEASHYRDVPPPPDASADGRSRDGSDVAPEDHADVKDILDTSDDASVDAIDVIAIDVMHQCRSNGDCAGGLVCCLGRAMCVDPRCSACCPAVIDAGIHDTLPVIDTPPSDIGGDEGSTGDGPWRGESGTGDATTVDVTDAPPPDALPPPDAMLSCVAGGTCPSGSSCCYMTGLCAPAGCLSCCMFPACTDLTCAAGLSCCATSGRCYPTTCTTCCP